MAELMRPSSTSNDGHLVIKKEIIEEISDENSEYFIDNHSLSQPWFKAETVSAPQDNKSVWTPSAECKSAKPKSTAPKRIVRPWEDSPTRKYQRRAHPTQHIVHYVPAYYPAVFYQMQSNLYHYNMAGCHSVPHSASMTGCHSIPDSVSMTGCHSMPHSISVKGCRHSTPYDDNMTECNSMPHTYSKTGCHFKPQNYSTTDHHSSPELTTKSSDSGYNSNSNNQKKSQLSSNTIKTEPSGILDDNKANIELDMKGRLLKPETIQMLEFWYLDNTERPYPGKQAVSHLARTGNITPTQVRKWLANKRVRSMNTNGKGRTSQPRPKTKTSSSRYHPYSYTLNTTPTKGGSVLPLCQPLTNPLVNIQRTDNVHPSLTKVLKEGVKSSTAQLHRVSKLSFHK